MWVNSANTVLAQEQAKEVRCIRIWIGKKKKPSSFYAYGCPHTITN